MLSDSDGRAAELGLDGDGDASHPPQLSRPAPAAEPPRLDHDNA
jgi:hypothetical protein